MLFFAAPFALADHETQLPHTQFGLIGYSENGRYLAYETFGHSGLEALGHATVHLIDLVEQRWVIGSPVSATTTDPSRTLASLRTEARARASFLIDDLHITRPAIIAAMIGDGVPGNDAQQLHFGIPRPDGEAVSVPFTLEIAAFDVQAAAACEGVMNGAPRGFSLHIESFGQNSEVYSDGPLPRSRGCPDDYRLVAVVIPYQADDMRHAVALVSVRNIAADGVSRSFVPVPLAKTAWGIN